jgi:hypothetical protein
MAISWIVFACIFGGTVLGMLLRIFLPKHHLDADSRNIVHLGMTLVATLSALVLGLLKASAKSSYDAQSGEITEMSTNFVRLDHILARYGPEAKEARDVLRRGVISLDMNWSQNARSEFDRSEFDSPRYRAVVASFYEKIQELAPRNDFERISRAKRCRLHSIWDERASCCCSRAASPSRYRFWW